MRKFLLGGGRPALLSGSLVLAFALTNVGTAVAAKPEGAKPAKAKPADAKAKGGTPSPSPSPVKAESKGQLDAKAWSGMQWREVGPFRGGRAIAIEGVPGEPNTYYFGGVAGGVWKTTD